MNSPTAPENTTSVITRGFSSATKSETREAPATGSVVSSVWFRYAASANAMLRARCAGSSGRGPA